MNHYINTDAIFAISGNGKVVCFPLGRKKIGVSDEDGLVCEIECPNAFQKVHFVVVELVAVIFVVILLVTFIIIIVAVTFTFFFFFFFCVLVAIE